MANPYESPEAQAGDESPVPSKRLGGFVVKLVLFLLVASAIGAAYFFVGDRLSLDYLAEKETALRSLQADHPVAVYVVAFVIYVCVTALSLPGAAAMTLVYGWLFDFVPAVILLSFASTSGATLAFLLSRYLIGDAIQARFGERLKTFNAALEREGAFYLFMLRLVPAAPFFVINLVMGLTKLRVRTFWWVSQIGMLPGTCVYVFAGSTVPTLKELAADGVGSILTPSLIGAFVVLGLFPLVVKKAVDLLRKRTSQESNEADDAKGTS